MSSKWRYGGLALCLAVAAAVAQDEAPEASDPAAPPPIPPAAPPPIPPKAQGETIEPTVTIRREEERTIEEYRLDGRVYMVKITPRRGVPYYYLDTDGDGMLELQPGDEGLNPVRPAYWKVREWD